MRSEVIDFPGGDETETNNVNFYRLLCNDQHHLVEHFIVVEHLIESDGPVVEKIKDAVFCSGVPPKSIPEEDESNHHHDTPFDALQFRFI